ncbi:MAG: 50S ribosomal protein L19, partial [Deltaproteobacteria bacterium]|nr:50S ribosomal protein L19 [Deltaproteobacteria bacterium]
DTIRVHIKIKEGEKERVQVFQGIVITKSGGGNTASFIVRKMSFGIGVERIFPMQCSSIEKIEVVEQGKVRRARPFYIRALKGKSLRIQKDERTRKVVDGDVTETTTIEKTTASASEDVTVETASSSSTTEVQTEANA